MATYFTIPNTSNCRNVFGIAGRYCLPIKEDCTPTSEDGILAKCDDRWNCNLCSTDVPYFVPYIKGDKIMIQTQFKDRYHSTFPSETNDFGNWINVQLEYSDDTVLTNMGLFASRWLASYNGETTYQIVEVDTSLLQKRCWSLRFTSAYGDELCTQEFQEVDSCNEHLTVKIQGKHERFDCFGNYYGNPKGGSNNGAEFRFDNTIRYWADLRNTSGNLTKEVFGRKMRKATTQNIFTFALAETPIPPFAHKMLIEMYFGAPETWIDDKRYEIDSLSVRNKIDHNNMLLYNVDLFTQCDISTQTC